MVTQLPLPQRGTAPNFWPISVVAKMAAWIKMSLGMEVGLGPGDCVRWETPPPPQKAGVAPQKIGPCLLWPNG